MNEDFRTRVLTPILLPLAVLAGIFVYAFSLSRVMLAIPAIAATIVALLIAAYVLGIAAVVGKRRTMPSAALGVGLAVGMIAVVGAGAVAMAVGPRELHAPTLEGEGDVAQGGAAEGDPAVEIPEDAAVFVGVDIDYSEAPSSLPGGLSTFALINEGAIEHNVVIEELGDELVAEAAGGETALGDVELEAGQEYTYYCSIPGHRAAGMEGTLTTDG